MEIRSLGNTPLTEIVACFNLAFSDYFVPIAATEEAMQNRWHSNRVDYSLSFGAFENNKLAGFIISGIDELHGIRTAYNAGTGVIPEFRGRKLVAQLYEHALPRFQAAGISQTTLEVIRQNEKAIKAYQGVGFKITRTLHCFKGAPKPKTEAEIPEKDYRLIVSPEIDLNLLRPLQSFDFSWENKDAAINLLANQLEAWQVYQGNELKGYLILNPVSGAVLQFGFSEQETAKAGAFLLNEISRKIPALKINNIDSQATEIIELLASAGLENHIDQYEMHLQLS